MNTWGMDASGWVGIACGLGVLLALICWAVRRWMMTRLGAKMNCPARLFRDLCRVHRLSWREAALLQRIARLQNLEQPALLFLDNSRFDAVDSADLGSTPAELQTLKRRLFGEQMEASGSFPT